MTQPFIALKASLEDPVWACAYGSLLNVASVGLYDDAYLKADILIGSHIFTQDVMRMPRVKKIFLAKSGCENINCAALEERGIEIWVSHACASLVAEHAVALALSLVHRVVEFDHLLRDGLWQPPTGTRNFPSMSTLNVGILGLGHIGSQIAQLIHPLCKKVFAIQGRGKDIRSKDQLVQSVCSVEELMRKCDLIFLAIPSTNETKGMLDARTLTLAQGSYIVNVGRFDVCNEEALFSLLADGTIAGFASDVWPHEVDKGNRSKRVSVSHYAFAQLPNVVLSPHCATHTEDGHKRYVDDAVRACKRTIVQNA